MEISKVEQMGASNILKWSIGQKINVKNDMQLASFINDETHFHVHLDEVNGFEMFRLIQSFKNKLRIVEECESTLPNKDYLTYLFPGNNSDPKMNGKSNVDIAVDIIQIVTGLSLQMQSDSDVIDVNVPKLFMPMLNRTYKVVVPISFIDVVNSLQPEDYDELFNDSYPSTLHMICNDVHPVNIMIKSGFMRMTSILKYDAKYDNYVNGIKYSALSNDKSNNVCKTGVIGFSKRDNISRGELRATLFKPNIEEMKETMRIMANRKHPLCVEFAVQMPIEYMGIVENNVDPDVLSVTYPSSVDSILRSGLVYNNFKTNGAVNKIDNYRVRIADVQKQLIDGIGVLVHGSNEDDYKIDLPSIFSLLPSMYSTRAVFTIDNSNFDKIYSYDWNPSISEMFKNMNKSIEMISNDIKNM